LGVELRGEAGIVTETEYRSQISRNYSCFHFISVDFQTRTENVIKGGGGGGEIQDPQSYSGASASASPNTSQQNQQEKWARERKMSVSNATMKSKWMKAFRSLKTPPGPSPPPSSAKMENEK